MFIEKEKTLSQISTISKTITKFGAGNEQSKLKKRKRRKKKRKKTLLYLKLNCKNGLKLIQAYLLILIQEELKKQKIIHCPNGHGKKECPESMIPHMFCSKCDEPLLEKIYVTVPSKKWKRMIMKSFKNNQIINLSEVDIRNKQITACNDKKSLRGKHPNSLKNLKPYPKGVSGNWKAS